MAVGMILNLVLLFSIAFLFAGPNGDQWVRSYMGNQGAYFVLVTVVLACGCYPFTRKLNIVKHK